MQNPQPSLVGRRAEAMAMVYLTTRPEIQMIGLGEGEEVDGFARIDRGDSRPGAIFAVIVRGTAKPLSSPKTADTYLSGTFKRFENGPPFFMPLLILCFSMHDDAGYVAWMVEPSGQGNVPKLIVHARPRSVPADRKALDEIVEKVNDWSNKSESIMFIRK